MKSILLCCEWDAGGIFIEEDYPVDGWISLACSFLERSELEVWIGESGSGRPTFSNHSTNTYQAPT